MIFVDRSRVPNPLDPSTKWGERALKEIKRAMEVVEAGAFPNKPFQFSSYKAPEVRTALEDLFHGKCAYCESMVSGVHPLDIEHFRPKTKVKEAPEHPGYWWLANSWENILASCVDCNRQRQQNIAGKKAHAATGKGDSFPLADEETRVYEWAEALDREQVLLLDPTVDHPEEHLVFDTKGMVFGETDKGNTTITVLGLNREGLVRARHERFVQFETLLSAIIASGENDDRIQGLDRYVADDAPYAGMMRQMVQSERVAEMMQQVGQSGSEQQKSKLEDKGVVTSGEATEARVDRARASREAFKASKSSYSFDNRQGRADYRTLQPLIERIEITDIRAIRQLNLVLGSGDRDMRSWLMLLGENGAGKSTVLQSVALALAGYDQVHRLVQEKWFEPASLVRSGCASGTISVWLTEFTKPHTLTVYPDRLEFRSPQGEEMTINADGQSFGTGWEGQTLVLAYGATRLMAAEPVSDKIGGAYSRIENLFHPFVPLIDAQAWLLGLDDLRFRTARDILHNLLDLDDTAALEPSEDRTEIVIKWPNETVRMKDLSDGYRTVLAMAADIMDVLSRIWPDLSEAVGVVLVDELDSHLHPTWQMKIVRALREAMSGVQFLATTHQPLCLRGLIEGEVVVMRRDESGLIASLTDLPSPAQLRVDQLLTSDFFGLKSTIDPDVEAKFDQYYALLALKSLTDDQSAELARLEAELKDRQQMGNSQRENLFYSAIDKILAQQDTQERREPEALEQEVNEKIGSMWQNALREAGVA